MGLAQVKLNDGTVVEQGHGLPWIGVKRVPFNMEADSTGLQVWM